MNHFRLRNWEKFQHYKDRNPPWIKLHTELLDNYDFSKLPDASKLLAFCIMLLAARSDNEIPADPEWIQSRCNLKALPDIGPLFDVGFIEWKQQLPDEIEHASSLLAKRKQRACSEAEAEAEAEAERDRADAFSKLKAEYPRRSGSQRWQDAEHAYRARIRDGHSHDEIIAGVRRYASFVKAQGNEGSSFVQQAATFLGTNKGFLEEWKPEAPKPKQAPVVNAARPFGT